MSRNRGKHLVAGSRPVPVDPFALPNLPATFTPEWRFKVFPENVRLALGENGVFHFLHIIPINSAIELHQKLGEFIADVIRKKAMAEAETETKQ